MFTVRAEATLIRDEQDKREDIIATEVNVHATAEVADDLFSYLEQAKAIAPITRALDTVFRDYLKELGLLSYSVRIEHSVSEYGGN